MNPVLIGAGLAAGNTALNSIGIGQQTGASKDLMDYQWKNFTSPQAQVRSVAAAGLNPAAVLSEGKGSFASPSVSMPTVSPVQMDGVDTLANYLVAKTQAEKNKVDTKLTDIEAQSKQFELDLNKTYAKPERVSNLLAAWKSMRLQDDEHARNEWLNAKEKFLADLAGIQKDTAQKVLDNMDTQIQQENKQRAEDIKLTQEKQRTEKTSQSANTAAARASNSQADVNTELQKIHSIEREVLEAGKVDKINSYLAELREKKMLSDERYQELRERIRSIKNRQDYADKHAWYGDFLNFMDDLSYYMSKFNPLNMVKPADIAPSK